MLPGKGGGPGRGPGGRQRAASVAPGRAAVDVRARTGITLRKGRRGPVVLEAATFGGTPVGLLAAIKRATDTSQVDSTLINMALSC